MDVWMEWGEVWLALSMVVFITRTAFYNPFISCGHSRTGSDGVNQWLRFTVYCKGRRSTRGVGRWGRINWSTVSVGDLTAARSRMADSNWGTRVDERLDRAS